MLSVQRLLLSYYNLFRNVIGFDKSEFDKLYFNDNSKPYLIVTGLVPIDGNLGIKTFKNMKEYIVNAFDYEYSNGIVEGINNVIKQIKHSACGYKKFNHLKARVMLIKGLLNQTGIPFIICTLISLPIILLYNGKKGRDMKWFFYWFYPVHIFIIAVIYRNILPYI